MATLFKPMDVQVDGNGLSMAGAKLYFYTTGTSTPQNTYSDSGLTTPNANPVVADANGLWPAIYLGLTDYKAILKTSADVTVLTLDPLLVNPQTTTLTADMDSQFGTTQYSIIQRGASTWAAITPKAFLDNKFGSTQGTIIYRGASDWTALAAPSAPSFLNHAGTGNNPAWSRRVYAYCTISGGVLTTATSSGITSVVRNSAGKFTITMSTAMADTNYRVQANMVTTSGAARVAQIYEDTAAGARSTTVFYLWVIAVDGGGFGFIDPGAMSIEVFA